MRSLSLYFVTASIRWLEGESGDRYGSELARTGRGGANRVEVSHRRVPGNSVPTDRGAMRYADLEIQ